MGSTVNQTTSPPTRWDVFLSFRGSDTRLEFNSHLYKSLDRTGIRTFVDDPELRAGEVISDALREAIQNSKIYIVVLSKNYASSRWCLDELVEILECTKLVGRLVVPVFYNIDPSVVRHQTDDFGKSFQELELHFDKIKMDSWRAALKQVAGISGHNVSAKRSEADIIDEVVDQVLQEIKPMTLEVAKYPVGIDSRVAGITPWLSSGTEGVIKIGIYGMVGIGKTTLAKAVYNQNFHRFKGCCFLASVRDVSKQQNGLQILQEQLIADVLKVKKLPIDNVDQGIAWIKQRMCLPKNFIVIDDIDSQYQFDSLTGPFAPGSGIIVTTRNQDLLHTIKVEHKYQYEVKKLDGAESLELFTPHAFGDGEPSDTFIGCFEDIVRHAGGLPLVLMFYGSNLLNKPVEGWQNFLWNLPQNPDARVQRKLIGSFEALDLEDHKLKDIFLDIACFFIGEDKEDVLKILETCYTSAEYKIDLLKMRCLMTINSENKLAMHELFQAMGRKIARNNR